MEKNVYIFFGVGLAALLAGCATMQTLDSDINKINTFVCNNQVIIADVAVQVKDNAAVTAINSACPAVNASNAASDAASSSSSK